MAGWIKLHRKILDNPVFLKPELYQLFSYCLLRANHSETKIIWNEQEETLEKGCFITGRKAIAKDIHQNERTTYDRLKLLQKLSMISVKSNNKYSVVRVLNYCVYQGSDTDTQQPANNQPTTNQQPANTNKNVKNDKKVTTPLHDADFEAFWSLYPIKKAKVDARKKWDLLMKNGVDPEKLIVASTKYAAERKGQEPKYTKHASTFLGPGKHYEECLQQVQPESKVGPERNWNKMTKEEQENWVS